MAAPQAGNQSDNSAGILWGVAAIFATIGVIWYVFKTQLIAAYLTIKFYEIVLVEYISGYLPFNHQTFEQLQAVILYARAHAATVGFGDVVIIGNQVGYWLRIPLAVLLIVLAFVVYFGNTAHVFKRTYNMRDLAKLERKTWPHINPVVDLDLLKTDIDVGPWAMALPPLKFCKRYKLLEEIRPPRIEGMSRKEWDRVEVVLKRGEANKLFALQLGPLWTNVESLPLHTQALFAVFAARINSDSAGAANLLAQLGSSATSKLNFTGVDALLKKHKDSKLVERVIQSHAYVLTVMATMLEKARDDGVQASADFLWLKPIDRRLWFTLNTVGRQTPFIEVAGVFAHWVAEKEAGRKLVVPMVEEATNALENALKEVVYRPGEDE